MNFRTQEFFSQVCLKFTLWFWKRNTIEIVNSFSLFCRYLLSEKGVALHLKNLVLVASVRGSEEKFKRSCMYFHYSVSIFPRKRRDLSFKDTLIHFDHSLVRIICAQYSWNWLRGSENEYFKMSLCVLLFCYYFPLEMGMTFHLKKNWMILCVKFGLDPQSGFRK